VVPNCGRVDPSLWTYGAELWTVVDRELWTVWAEHVDDVD